MKHNGKTAFITGASAGIGRACAVKFAKEGANVVLADIDFEKLLSVKEEVGKYNKNVLILECDVSNTESVKKAFEKAAEAFGGVDILINNAGLWRLMMDLELIPDETVEKFVGVNILGTFYCTREALPYMKEKGWGRIINIGSVAGEYGNAKMTVYSATKGAVISFTKALAKEVAQNGILVNCVSPGTVSPSENADMDFVQPSELSYLGRTGSANENADLISFLASDEASYISGQNILIDGCRKKI